MLYIVFVKLREF